MLPHTTTPSASQKELAFDLLEPGAQMAHSDVEMGQMSGNKQKTSKKITKDSVLPFIFCLSVLFPQLN